MVIQYLESAVRLVGGRENGINDIKETTWHAKFEANRSTLETKSCLTTKVPM